MLIKKLNAIVVLLPLLMKPNRVQDNDVCIDLPTLSLNTYEPDLPGFDTVLKLGSKGAPESTQTVALQPEVNIPTIQGGRRRVRRGAHQ